MVQREWREFFWKVLEEVEEIKEENNEIKEHDKNENKKKKKTGTQTKISWRTENLGNKRETKKKKNNNMEENEKRWKRRISKRDKSD